MKIDKTTILKFKKGQKIHMDEREYPLAHFDRCFDKVGDDELADNEICNKSVKIIIVSYND